MKTSARLVQKCLEKRRVEPLRLLKHNLLSLAEIADLASEYVDELEVRLSKSIHAQSEAKVLSEDNNLIISAFYGGQERGPCIQLTIVKERAFIQLRAAAVEKLVETLTTWLKAPK